MPQLALLNSMDIAVDLYMHLMSELLQGMTLLKMVVAILMVVTLSVLAETVSPRFAGVLSGYPLGAAISLFFIGFEVSPRFAAESAVYTTAGLVATQVFAYAYYKASSLAGDWGGKLGGILSGSAAGILGYFLAASVLRVLPLNLPLAVLLPTLSIFVFIGLFRKVGNVKIEKRAGLNPRVLFLRSIVAALLVVLITSTARLVGPRWAGLFSAFPVTLLPFVVIVHYTYELSHVHAILKNVPKGIGSLVVYTLAVSIVYPALGIYLGTALAYLLATLYLVVIHWRYLCPFPGRT